MAGFHTLVIGWQCQGFVQPQQTTAFGLGITKMLQQHVSVGMFKIPSGKLNFRAFENIAIHFSTIAGRHPVPIQVIDIINALNKHRQPFQTIG